MRRRRPARSNDSLEAYTGKITGRKQDSHPAKATQPRDGTDAGGDGVPVTEPNTSQSAKGEDGQACRGLRAWHVRKEHPELGRPEHPPH